MGISGNALVLKSRSSSIDWSQASIGIVAGIAALAVVGLVLAIVWMSLKTRGPGEPAPHNLTNHTWLLAHPYSYRVMVTTLIFSAVTIAVSVPLGFVFAWLIERTDLPYKAVAMSLLSIGILFPTFLKAMGWVFLCHPRIGVINIFL